MSLFKFKDNIAKYALLLAFLLLTMNLQYEYGEAARISHFSAIPESMATMSSSRMIVLNSSDGETFEVEEAVALNSKTIKRMIEEDCAGNNILLPNVTGKILAKVIEYCKHHVEAAGKICDKTSKIDLKKFDAEFVKVDQSTLFDLVLAANYLDINSLLDLTSNTVAEMIYGKTPDQIRKMFNIKNGFEPEEEKEAMREIGHLSE